MRLSLGKSKDELIAFAANHRWEVETGGITINGVLIATDDRSKTMIMGALMAARENPEWSTIWQTPNGGVPIVAQQIEEAAIKIQVHVNNVFLAYAEVVDRINDGTLVSTTQIVSYFDSLMQSSP